MRIATDDQRLMRRVIEPLDTPELRARYLAGDFPRSELTQDVNKRYRWDLFWRGYQQEILLRLMINQGDYKDAHIDTALRQIVKDLK